MARLFRLVGGLVVVALAFWAGMEYEESKRPAAPGEPAGDDPMGEIASRDPVAAPTPTSGPARVEGGEAASVRAPAAPDDRGGVLPSTPAADGAPERARQVRDEYRRLFRAFQTTGWEGVLKEAAQLTRLLSHPDGARELLALVSDESNPYYIDCLLQCLAFASPGGGSGAEESWTRDPETVEGFWSLFANEGDAGRRGALLSLFTNEPTLLRLKRDAILQIATNEEDDDVQRRALAGLVRLNDDPEVLSLLCYVARENSTEKTRATAMFALRGTTSDPALAILRDGLESDSETIRSAALESFPPVMDSDERAAFVGRLSDEFRSAETHEYRYVLIQRLLADSPGELEGLLSEGLESASSDEKAVAYYESLLDLLRRGVTSPVDINRLTSERLAAFRFSR